MQRSGYRTRSRAPGAPRGPPPACPGAPEPKPGRSRWREVPPPSSSASRRVMRPRRGTGSWCPRATCGVTFAETSSAPWLRTKSASSFPRAHLILSRSLDTYAVPSLPRIKSKLSRAAEVTVPSPVSTASSGTPEPSPASIASSGTPEPQPRVHRVLSDPCSEPGVHLVLQGPRAAASPTCSPLPQTCHARYRPPCARILCPQQPESSSELVRAAGHSTPSSGTEGTVP